MGWHLKIHHTPGHIDTGGTFETLGAATRRIIQIEDVDKSGLFYEVHVVADIGTEADSLTFLTYTGTRASYTLKRVMN